MNKLNEELSRMRELMEQNQLKFTISESTVNRIEKWVNNKEIAIISAFRNQLINYTNKTLMDIEPEGLYTHKQCLIRNKKLKSLLLVEKYGVTKIAGSYIEGFKTSTPLESQEESFFVVNLHDDPNFKEKISELSEFFNQDAFLHKHKNEENATLIGTNLTDFPGYHNEVQTGSFYKKVSAQFMSRIGAQGFAFSNEDNPIEPDEPYTFHKRKEHRSQKNKDVELNEMSIRFFKIETFNSYNSSAKLLISNEAKQARKELNELLNKNNK